MSPGSIDYVSQSHPPLPPGVLRRKVPVGQRKKNVQTLTEKTPIRSIQRETLYIKWIPLMTSLYTTTLIQESLCCLFPLDRWHLGQGNLQKQGEMCEVNHVSVPGARHALPSTYTHPTDRQLFGFRTRGYAVR
ncbi:hypothetical protein AVEN_139659-1 [Araneus ventricosus]|uniref:Uncharacterized protein n=1 Tax=Araneus ventricosus TaxID=182803 RepID=A0A4Y2FU90_ARAVE|nr:hypothetical protein AVEN_139659-1 [Araneus ventricosus]